MRHRVVAKGEAALQVTHIATGAPLSEVLDHLAVAGHIQIVRFKAVAAIVTLNLRHLIGAVILVNKVFLLIGGIDQLILDGAPRGAAGQHTADLMLVSTHSLIFIDQHAGLSGQVVINEVFRLIHLRDNVAGAHTVEQRQQPHQ